MNQKNNESSSRGLGIGGEVVQIVLIVLKLVKVIDWSWWWVLAPTWISIGLLVLVLILAAIFS